MAQIEVTKQKIIYTCDICGEDLHIENASTLNRLGIEVQGNWWDIFKFDKYMICIKHRKKVIKFLEELKKEVKK